MIIRGLALDEIKLKDYFKAIWKETRIALIIGIVLAIVNGISIMLQYSDAKLVLIVGITLIGNIFLAQILGCILPLIAKKIKIDPAIMAAPLIATILDMCAVVIYFNIAMLVIKFM
jgi:magnesium transporter